jgi:hypothetical protein
LAVSVVREGLGPRMRFIGVLAPPSAVCHSVWGIGENSESGSLNFIATSPFFLTRSSESAPRRQGFALPSKYVRP